VKRILDPFRYRQIKWRKLPPMLHFEHVASAFRPR
jgi:hypothetical protein